MHKLVESAGTPNPAHDATVIYMPEINTERVLTLTDMYGSQVYSTHIEPNASQYALVTTHIPSGIYFVRVSGLRQAIKLIVTR